MLQSQRLLILLEHLGEASVRTRVVSRGSFIDAKIRCRHQRIGVVGAQRLAALGKRLLANLYRLTQPSALSEVGSVINIRRQRKRMQIPVDQNESCSGLLVIRKRFILSAPCTEDGC